MRSDERFVERVDNYESPLLVSRREFSPNGNLSIEVGLWDYNDGENPLPSGWRRHSLIRTDFPEMAHLLAEYIGRELLINENKNEIGDGNHLLFHITTLIDNNRLHKRHSSECEEVSLFQIKLTVGMIGG